MGTIEDPHSLSPTEPSCSFPRLVELDLAFCRLSFLTLRAILKSCGHTLQRLDLSDVRCPYRHPRTALNASNHVPNYPHSTDDEADC